MFSPPTVLYSIHNDWNRRAISVNRKSKNTMRELRALLEEQYSRLSNHEKTSLVASLEASADSYLSTEFAMLLSQVIVEELVLSESQESEQILLRILKVCPPDRMRHISFEQYLAEKNNGKYFCILFTAYYEANREHARKVLLSCLEQAFPRQADLYSDRDKFVVEASRWYKEKRQKLEIRPDYYLVSLPWMPNRSAGLFILRKD